MTGCDICEMIAKKESFKIIYEDAEIIGMLHEAPAFLGHSLLMPKTHFRIIEEVPENTAKNMFIIANKVSTALFESMNIHGTNIIANNGPEAGQVHPHFMINIIPRTENDGINLEWQQEKWDNQRLESTFKFLKPYVERSILGDTGEPRKIEQKDEVIKSDENDYRILQFRRQP